MMTYIGVTYGIQFAKAMKLNIDSIFQIYISSLYKMGMSHLIQRDRAGLNKAKREMEYGQESSCEERGEIDDARLHLMEFPFFHAPASVHLQPHNSRPHTK